MAVGMIASQTGKQQTFTVSKLFCSRDLCVDFGWFHSFYVSLGAFMVWEEWTNNNHKKAISVVSVKSGWHDYVTHYLQLSWIQYAVLFWPFQLLCFIPETCISCFSCKREKRLNTTLLISELQSKTLLKHICMSLPHNPVKCIVQSYAVIQFYPYVHL